MTAEEFDQEFNSRTLAYTRDFRSDDRPVVVAIGDGAHNAVGHLLAASLTNMLARAHRRLVFVGDLEREFVGRNPFGHRTLAEATVGFARAINPHIDVVQLDAEPTSRLVSIGVGAAADLRLGADGWCAIIGPQAEVPDDPGSFLGAGLAAILAAASAFHMAIGHEGITEGTFSLWEGGSLSSAQGPQFTGPLDVGDVLQIGAGAVGAALAYWLAPFGIVGQWVIIDGDLVEVSNLNRQMMFVAADAGYPDAEPSNKAVVVAERIGGGASPIAGWYDVEDPAQSRIFDVILPLADEGGVRPALQARAEPVLLHATTTQGWGALFHRHVAGRDDCIVCRLPRQGDPLFKCSTAPVSEDRTTLASLPFLSAAAGLLLLGGLVRLGTGQLLDSPNNLTWLDFTGANPSVREYPFSCREDCRRRLPVARRAVVAAGTRWAHLDGDVNGG